MFFSKFPSVNCMILAVTGVKIFVAKVWHPTFHPTFTAIVMSWATPLHLFLGSLCHSAICSWQLAHATVLARRCIFSWYGIRRPSPKPRTWSLRVFSKLWIQGIPTQKLRVKPTGSQRERTRRTRRARRESQAAAKMRLVKKTHRNRRRRARLVPHEVSVPQPSCNKHTHTYH